MSKKQICVFTSARDYEGTPWGDVAIETGKLIGEQGYHLVYGGSMTGTMANCANAALKAGAEVTGVFVDVLRAVEPPHDAITNLIIAEDMHARKATMATLSDAFIILSGGLGTMEEFFEIWAHRKIKLHDKPIVLVNYQNFYTSLLQFLNEMLQAKMFDQQHMHMLKVVNTPAEALHYLNDFFNPS